LRKNKSIASGAINDIRIQQNKFGNTYVLSLGYPENKPASKYFEYVNKGVRGTKNEKADSKTPFKFNSSKKSIPVSVIEGWLGYNKLKAVSVKPYRKLGVESKAIDSKKSLAYVIARSIHRKGLRSTHYFDEALTSTFGSNFTIVMIAALGEDINIKIQATNKQNNGNNNTK